MSAFETCLTTLNEHVSDVPNPLRSKVSLSRESEPGFNLPTCFLVTEII